MDATGSAWRYRLATDVDGLVRTELVEAEEATLQATSGAAIAAVGVGSALLLGFDT